MPNWVTNNVSFEGNKEKIKEMMENFKEDGGDFGSIDFNKIEPMPETLMVTAGGSQNEAICVYLSAINPRTEDMGIKKFSKKEFKKLLDSLGSEDLGIKTEYNTNLTYEEVKEKCNAFTSRNIKMAESEYCKEDLFVFGKTCCENVAKYGAKDWYSWSCKYWGTKWNASESSGSLGYMCFQTAWSTPYKIFEKLSELYPDIKIICEYADEDMGHNCGIIECFNSTTKFTDMSGDYKFAAEVLGMDLDDYYETKDGKLYYIEDFPMTARKETIDDWIENQKFSLHGFRKKMKLNAGIYDLEDFEENDILKFLKRMEKCEIDIDDFFYS